ncbi:hypothetical protein ACP86_13805 [Marinobacter sp. CP1]|jgi:hypothetical protein|uniref:hypothetical protein n=1 Tax=Marinobacter sp. CP1 TaxID=1671721 RepID=UPI00069FA801|nr:hypothetical protein [Marinobacter sp. CP1]AKV97141.1 hypothetical protein ACP86_13805 [Marinobacter sp. CP1]
MKRIFFALLCACLAAPMSVASLASASTRLKSDIDFGILAERICYMYLKPGDKASNVKHTIIDFAEDALGLDSPSKEQIITILNDHKHELTCGDKHFMSHAIKRGLYNEIFYFLFFDESDLYSEEHKLDFNAVTKTYNPVTEQYEYMTVLDYIEQVALNSRQTPGSTRELKEMREDIIDLFGAKRYSELSPEEQAEGLAVIRAREAERQEAQ